MNDILRELDDESRAEYESWLEERGQMHDADDEAMDRWARYYDELNGAPENDDDR